MTSDAHVLLYPSAAAKDSGSQSKMDLWNDFLISVKTRIGPTKNNEEKTLECMSEIIPVLVEAENYQIREKYIRIFASYRITTAFIFPHPASNKLREQVKEWFPVVTEYLEDYLTNKDQNIEKLKAMESEEELSCKNQEADKLMKQGSARRVNGNYEEAIACFNKAIEIYPANPEAFMESGRGYNKIKKYTRAIARFREAEEVSTDLPAQIRRSLKFVCPRLRIWWHMGPIPIVLRCKTFWTKQCPILKMPSIRPLV